MKIMITDEERKAFMKGFPDRKKMIWYLIELMT
jgi:hypothetical protein